MVSSRSGSREVLTVLGLAARAIDILKRAFPDLAPALEDGCVSEIMMNGDGCVFIEVHGVVAQAPFLLSADKRKSGAIMIARVHHREIDEANPFVHITMEDGSRVTMAYPPVSVGGTTISIRKFQREFFAMQQHIAAGSVTPEQANILCSAVQNQQTMLIAGGTSSGKTSLGNALANEIPQRDRVALIEDTSEMQIGLANLIRFECRTEQRVGDKVLPAVTAMEAVSNAALRLRPDRIILGEIRGPEAFALVRALNSGHPGSLSTIHATTPIEALDWLAALALTGAPSGMTYDLLQRFVAYAIHLVVLVRREQTKRRVVSITRVGYDAKRKTFRLSEVKGEN